MPEREGSFILLTDLRSRGTRSAEENGGVQVDMSSRTPETYDCYDLSCLHPASGHALIAEAVKIPLLRGCTMD